MESSPGCGRGPGRTDGTCYYRWWVYFTWFTIWLYDMAYVWFVGMVWHIYIGFDGISLTCWHFHVSIHISMMMIFKWVEYIYILLFFWEGIQVLRRGVRKIIFEKVFERFVFAHSRFCFAPFQVLASVVGGIWGSSSYSDRPSLM